MYYYVLFVCLDALISYNEGKICTVNTSTGFIHTNSSTSGGSFELLDDVNCTEYKLSPNNDGSSGAVPISVPFSLFQNTHNRIYVRSNVIYIHIYGYFNSVDTHIIILTQLL